MKIDSILGNSQCLDGGAMFGNAPKAMWQKWCPPDELNRINLATRALLVQHEEKKILFEAGVGTFMEPKLKKRYGVREAEHVLLKSLEDVGVRPDEITHVVLSHLHFDHSGGILKSYDESGDNANKGLELVFNKAKYIVSRPHFERAKHPHYRDRASFIPGLCELLENTGRLLFIEENHAGSVCSELGDWVEFLFSNGHTPGLMLAKIKFPNKQNLIYTSDLIPGTPWVHLPITMGYDRYPEKVIEEKEKLLKRAHKEDTWLYFVHDFDWAAAKLTFDEKGRFGLREKLKDVHWDL